MFSQFRARLNEFRSLYGTRQMGIMLLMGFSEGVPFRLMGSVLQAWMNDAGISLQLIGASNLIRLPYSLKFLWSPFLDRYSLGSLGRRRGWMMLAQLLLIVGIIIFGQLSPSQYLMLFLGMAVVISFLSATQDIAIDAYRAESLPKDQLGAGATVTIFGFRLAMIFAGSIPLILAEYLPWNIVYTIASSGIVLGLIATFFCREADTKDIAPTSLRRAVIDPFVDFISRNGSREILLFIILFKLGDIIAGSITMPFFLEIGFTKAEVGVIDKMVGMASLICGGLYGGHYLAKHGLRRSLICFGILQAVGTALFGLLALAGKSYVFLTISIVAENMFIGMGTSAQVAFLMSICNQRFTATQYALLTSIASVSGIFAGSFSGVLSEVFGWPTFFFLCSFIALPGIWLVKKRYESWNIA